MSQAPTQAAVLGGILGRVKTARAMGRKPLVLLDLDDTVLATAQRHVRIMAEFAALRAEARALAAVEPSAVRYLVVETAKAAGVADEAVLAELRDFWFKRFFTNDYLLADDEVPGAAAFCRAVHEAGGVPVYFTGRDETMREGTLQSLARHGFPAPGANGDGAPKLVLKPKFDTPDLEYKSEALIRLAKTGSVEAGFENEPAHVNLFAERFPKATMVFVDTRHSGRPVTVKAGIPAIKDFRL